MLHNNTHSNPKKQTAHHFSPRMMRRLLVSCEKNPHREFFTVRVFDVFSPAERAIIRN